jgi:CxxC motif-containing protein (DUF1111 family)
MSFASVRSVRLALLAGLFSLPLLSPIASGSDAITRTDLPLKDLQRVRSIVIPTTDFSKAERFELMQGGAATSTHPVNGDAFSHFSANLTFQDEEDFKLGNALFRKLWVSSPSSTQASDVSAARPSGAQR